MVGAVNHSNDCLQKTVGSRLTTLSRLTTFDFDCPAATPLFCHALVNYSSLLIWDEKGLTDEDMDKWLNAG